MEEYQQLSLREAARFDHERKVKDRLTGWGIICAERHAKFVARYGEGVKLSRKQRREVK